MDLKARLAAREPLLGTFLKTAHHVLVEVLAQTDLDFLVLDAEHAPFTLAEIDRCILAGRASGIPVLVRLVDDSAASILQVLDMGAAGIVVPHVDTAEQARKIVDRTRYVPGGRGFAGTNRGGGYGTLSPAELRARAEATIVFAQIESEAAVTNASAIAQVKGVDACFVGRADLGASIGIFDPGNARVADLTREVIDATRAANKSSALFVGTKADIPLWRDAGANVFLLASEHKAISAFFSGL